MLSPTDKESEEDPSFTLIDGNPLAHSEALTCTVLLQRLLDMLIINTTITIDDIILLLQKDFCECAFVCPINFNLLPVSTIPAQVFLTKALKDRLADGNLGPLQFLSSSSGYFKCYLALSLDGLGEENRWVLMWRTGRLFTIDDVTACRCVFYILSAHFKRPTGHAAIGVNLSTVSELEEALMSCNEPNCAIFVGNKDGTLESGNADIMDCIRTEAGDKRAANFQWFNSMLQTPIVIDRSSKELTVQLKNSVKASLRLFFPFKKDKTLMVLKSLEDSARSLAQQLDPARPSEHVQSKRMLAELSHEIRTPLSGIIGSASLLNCSNSAVDGEQMDLVRTIRVCSKQLYNLICDFLDLTKLEDSKVCLEKKPFALESIMQECINMNSVLANERDLWIIVNLYDEWPHVIVGDEVRLKQILNNLLSNALKFSNDHGSIEVSVECDDSECTSEEIAQDVITLRFMVVDEGVGIPNNLKIFEPYVQKSSTGRYGGTGLGLSICKRLVSLMRGNIWYDSEPEKGTRMMFTIKAETLKSVKAPDRVFLFIDIQKSLQEYIDSFYNEAAVMILISCSCLPFTQFIKRAVDKLNLHSSDSGIKEMGFSAVQRYINSNSQPSCMIVLITDHQDTAELEQIVEVAKMQLGIILIENPLHASPSSVRARRTRTKNIIPLARPFLPSQLIKTLHEAMIMALLHRSIPLTDEPPASFQVIDSSSTSVSVSNSPSVITSVNKTASSVGFSIAYPLRILVADDNQINQKLLVKALSHLGYINILVANDGQQAVQCCTTSAPDLIFMDMQMPKMSGVEATFIIRHNPAILRQPHIIALTANAFPEDRKECEEAGMCLFLVKPIDWNRLEGDLMHAYQVTVTHEESCLSCSKAVSELR